MGKIIALIAGAVGSLLFMLSAQAFTPPSFNPPSISEPQIAAQNGLQPANGGALWLPGYWFADGYLAQELQGTPLHLQNQAPVLLYGWPDARATATGLLAPGGRARLLAIGCWAWPELSVIGAKEKLRSAENSGEFQQFGYISSLDAKWIAVYSQGYTMALPREQLQGAIPPSWGEGERGQWLYLQSSEGIAGWTHFSPAQWLVQTPAADGRAHLLSLIEKGTTLNFLPLPALKARTEKSH